MKGDIRYNTHLKKKIEVGDAERFCPKCRGNGKTRTKSGRRIISLICDKCLGNGKIDWVEEATGVVAER